MNPDPRGMGTWSIPSIAQVGEGKTDAFGHPFFLDDKIGRGYSSGPSLCNLRLRNERAANFRSIQVICALHKSQCKIQAPLCWRGFCRHWALFQW